MSHTFKRKEIKYLITEDQQKAFMKDISGYIENDQFSRYTICNVYFDTPDSRLIRRSIEKPIYKEKMRLRSYGVANEKSDVFIELKKKYEGIVYKRRISMNTQDALSYIAGNHYKEGQIEQEIHYFLEMYDGISPSMYISYEREAYFVSEKPDIRITFDDNILWRDEDVSLTSEVYGQSLLEKGQKIMEIKCSDAMPLWLVKALSNHQIYQRSFSKYGSAYLKKIA